MAKQGLLATTRDWYQRASKKDKGRILHEFIAITGHHRKLGRNIRRTGKNNYVQSPNLGSSRRRGTRSPDVVPSTVST